MAAILEVVAGDECVCACHRDPSIQHVVACCADCEQCATRVVTGSLSTHKPSRCAGFRSGRLALHVDAVISVLAGIAVIVLGLVHTVMPTAVHAVVGVALAAWGVALWLAPARWPLRAVLAVVTAVNIVALIALVVVAAVTSGDLRWLALVGALVVVIIGIWEWLALRKTQGPVGETR